MNGVVAQFRDGPKVKYPLFAIVLHTSNWEGEDKL